MERNEENTNNVEWDIDANLPLYTRDYLRSNDIIGYKIHDPAYITDHIYRPEDVTIIMRKDSDKEKHDDGIKQFIRTELRRGMDERFLKEVTGPDIFGEGNFEVYTDEDGEWQIRPVEGWKPAELRGIFSESYKEKPTADELMEFIEESIIGKPLEGWQQTKIENWLEYNRTRTIKPK